MRNAAQRHGVEKATSQGPAALSPEPAIRIEASLPLPILSEEVDLLCMYFSELIDQAFQKT
jgi:hypothetical protein